MSNETELSLTNVEIVTLALAILGGANKSIDIEEIGIKAYELAPKKFCWRKHPERIDLRTVQYALKDASSKKKEETLIKGNIRFGYMLTSKGISWSNKIIGDEKEISVDTKKIQTNEEKRIIEEFRLINSTAMKKFKANMKETINKQDFQDFARVNDYFPDHIKKHRYILIENSIKENKTLKEVWKYLKDNFSDKEGSNHE